MKTKQLIDRIPLLEVYWTIPLKGKCYAKQQSKAKSLCNGGYKQGEFLNLIYHFNLLNHIKH